MPALTVKQMPVTAIKRYERNPRKNEQAVAAVARSIQEFGWRQPIVVDSNMVIVAGDTRYLAALELGHAKVPVHVAAGLTPVQVKAWRIADNKVGELADWNDDLLGLEFRDLQGLDFDLSQTAFSDAEIAKLLRNGGGLTDPDDVPEPPEDPVTQPGDLWSLGAHRLLCGDATAPDAVERLLAGVTPLLMVADPPYGVGYDPAWRQEAADKGLIGFPPSAMGTVTNDDQVNWAEAWALFPGDVVYVWYASLMHAEVAGSLVQNGFEVRSQIIWAKSSFAISRGHYHWQHETCIYAVRGHGHWGGDRSQSTLWQIPHNKNDTGHGTQKPVECMRRPIVNNSSPGQAVYDPFLGSGTTMIAAEMEGRICYGLEIDPIYCDVIVKRWQEFTGETAERDA